MGLLLLLLERSRQRIVDLLVGPLVRFCSFFLVAS